MTHNQKIETMREIRLWTTQICVPAMVLAGTVILAKPEIIDDIRDHYKWKKADREFKKNCKTAKYRVV